MQPEGAFEAFPSIEVRCLKLRSGLAQVGKKNRITDAFGAILEDDVDILGTTRVPNFSRRRYGKRRVRDLVRCCGGDKDKFNHY